MTAVDEPLSRWARFVDVVRWPPPADQAHVFHARSTGAAYLAGWGLTSAHLVLWVLLFVGVLTGLGWTIAASVIAFGATVIFIVMVIGAHRRAGGSDARLHRQILGAWWRGPWDPVGRQVWMPVRLGAAWRAVRQG